MDTDYTLASQVDGNLAWVDYDVNVGQAGANVTVAIIASGIDKSHPAFSERTISDPLSPSHISTPQDVERGTRIAIIAAGLVGDTAYGVAYKSEIEFVNEGFTTAEYLSAIEHLGTSSDSFVVNDPFGGAEGVEIPYLIQDEDRCNRAARSGAAAVCSDGAARFYLPSDNLSPSILPVIYKSCADPDGARVNSDGTKERICVSTSGDDGWHDRGIIYACGRACEEFDVSSLLGDDSPLFDADKQAMRDALYSREGANNIPEEDARQEGHHLVVAALEPNTNRLADFTNGCGDAMQYCLVAPGKRPLDPCSTDSSGVCGVSSPGDLYPTPYAVPIVSGAAAVVKSTYPHLSAPSVVSILLETATDIGPSGTDKDFGRGRLNILGSLQPVGEKLTSAGESLSETVIKAGPSLGSALARSTASFGLFDSYKRPYLHFVSGRVSSQGSALDALNGFMRDSSAMVNADVRQRMGLLGTGETRAPAAVVLRKFDDDTIQIDSGFENCSLGCLSSRDVKVSSLVPSTARVWSEQHVSVPFGRMGTVVEVGFADDTDAGFSSGGLFYAGRLGNSSLLRLEAGAMVERETFMGSSFGGALELSAGRGQYVSAQLGTEFGAGAFSASYTLGKERAGRAIGSLVTEVSVATYDGYRLAYGGEGWEFHHTVPLAATGGGMRIESVGGYTGDQGDWSVVDSGGQFAIVGGSGSDDWAYRTDSHWIDFSAAGRERRTGVILNRPFGVWDSVFALEHVSNSPREGHVGGEARVAVGFELDFD